MFKYKILLIYFSLLIFYGCSKETENVSLIKETNQKEEMNQYSNLIR